MTDRPALMSAPMVRAIQREIEQPGSGKTMTRRLAWRPWTADQIEEAQQRYAGIIIDRRGKPTIWQSVRPGDRLWVRETTWINGGFVATDEPNIAHEGKKPSIFMKREESRLTLLVTAARMELAHEISEEDAKAEGFASGQLDDGFDERPFGDTGLTISSPGTLCSAAGMAQIYFAKQYPDPSWDAYSSPEVVVISFRPVLANIDRMAEAA